jgi:hypothetical protein
MSTLPNNRHPSGSMGRPLTPESRHLSQDSAYLKGAKPEVKRSLFQHRGLARILHPSISTVAGNKDVFARLTWPEVAPSLLPGLLFGARFRIHGYLYAGEEIEIARRT